MKKRNIFIILLCLLLVFIDVLSKYLIVTYLGSNNVLILIKNFLKFMYIKNTGAALGFLSGNTIILIIITCLLLFYIFKEIKKNVNNKLILFSYLLIFSGALGNLIDRIFRGYVVDFISFTLFNKEMAIFNVADIYITFGVIILLIMLVREMYHEKNNNK